MTNPFISNLGFTTVSTAGTLNTKAGSKDNLPVQYYKLTADITGVLTINNNANHAKIILDMNDRNLVGASGTGTATSPVVFNGTGTVEIKGGGLITAGGQLSVSDSGNSAYNQTPSGGDGIVTNDGGTMRQTNVQTFSTYFNANAFDAPSAITSTSTLTPSSAKSIYQRVDCTSGA